MFNSGFRGKREQDGRGVINPQSQYVQTKYPQPAITGWSISGSDDTALNPAGGQTVLVNGSGFVSGASVTVGGTQIGAVTVVSPTQLSFTSPANAGGSYSMVVYNSAGGAAILVPGLVYSSVPSWTTPAGSIGSYYETTNINSNVVATADSAITYSLASGTLPSGATLYANGVISGTAPVDSGSTTYTFAVTATDAELQDTTRTFTLTINTDVVTWVSPSSNPTYNLPQDTQISNVTLSATDAAGYAVSYSANTLPTGLSLSGNVIYGTPTVANTTYSLVTATAATTNRSSALTFTWNVSLATDTSWQYNSLVLSSSAPNATNLYVQDTSTNNFAITVNGNTAPAALFPNGFCAWQFANANASVGSSTGTQLSFGTADFTMEAWIYLTIDSDSSASREYGILGADGAVATTGISVRWLDATGFFRSQCNLAGSGKLGTARVPTNKWVHIAWSRISGTLKGFIDGVLDHNAAATNSVSVSSGWRLGILDSSAIRFPGLISNVRVTKGVGLYNAAFTPPTGPLAAINGTSVLTAQTPRLVDQSMVNSASAPLTVYGAAPTSFKVSNATPFALTYTASPSFSYSSYFDGNGDYLVTDSSAGLGFGTGDFTVEGWVYTQLASKAGSRQTIFDCRAEGNSTDPKVVIFLDATNHINYYVGETEIIYGGILSACTWYHFAVVRSSGTSTMYLNGVVTGTPNVSDTTNYATTDAVIGTVGDARGSFDGYYKGYISNIRAVKGTAVYTSQFVPPTSALTAISGTSLLTCAAPILIDQSSAVLAVTPNGNALATANSPFANPLTATTPVYSVYFDGTDDYIRFPNNAATNIGTGDFTMEFWMYGYNGNTARLVSNSDWNTTAGYDIAIEDGEVHFRSGNNNDKVFTYSADDYNKWIHVAYSRSGTTFRVFKNGIIQNTYTTASNLTSANPTTLCSQGGGGFPSDFFNGFLSNLRIVKGTALYTANFVPTLAPLTAVASTGLLTCQSATIVDNSTNNLTPTVNGNTIPVTQAPFYPSAGVDLSTAGSTYFDGTGDYLLPASSSAFTVGTGDFTIEAWIYPTVTSGAQGVFGLADTGSSGDLVFFYNLTANKVTLNEYGGTAATSTASIPVNAWSHIAFSRVSGSLTTFINGALDNTTSFSGNFTKTAAVIGRSYSTLNQEYFTGYISNLRLVKGTGVYTTAFVPSPALTAVSGTSLLTLQTNQPNNANYAVSNKTFSTLITQAGNARIGTVAPYGANWSNYFGGTNGALTVPDSAQFTFGTSAYTIEGWVYLTTLGSSGDNAAIFENKRNGGGVQLVVYNDGGTMKVFGGDSTDILVLAGSLSVGTWYHVALCRSGSNTRAFLNGTQVGSTYTTLTNYTTTTGPIIGYSSAVGNTNGLTPCYISNVRVVKGTALYTTTFTPATSLLTAVSGTSLLTCQSNRLIDNSANNFSITKSNTVNINRFSPFSDRTVTLASYSNYFDGDADYLQFTSTSIINFSDQPYTVEFWVYYTATPANNKVILYGGNFRVYVTTNNYAQLWYGASEQVGSTNALNLNAWNHVAIVRSSTSINGTAIYTNGTKFTGTDDATWPTSAGYISYNGSTANTSFLGYISNLRIVKGTAVYTGASITPPTSALTAIGGTSLLTCQSNTLVDNSVYAAALTVGGSVYPSQYNPFASTVSTNPTSWSLSTFGSSMYFDGTGDYYQLPTSFPGSNMGYADFTVEAWIYPTTYSGSTQYIICGQGDAASAAGSSWVMCIGSSATCDAYSSTTAITATAPNPTVNTWSHVAFVRSGTSLKTYLNGVQVGSGSFASATTVVNLGINNPMTVGAVSGGSFGLFGGYISGLRVVKSALYTARFNPPSTPPVALASTAFLPLNNTGVVDWSMINDLESVGNAVTVSSPIKYGNTSMYFDGTGDYLSISSSPVMNFGTGSFTVAAWIYPTTIASDWFLISATGTGGMFVGYATGVGFGWGRTGTAWDYRPGTITANTWQYVAVTRNGTSMYVFINGVQAGTTQTLSTAYDLGATSTTVGSQGANYYFNGYISDLVVTNGVARYTSNFTPPSSALATF